MKSQRVKTPKKGPHLSKIFTCGDNGHYYGRCLVHGNCVDAKTLKKHTEMGCEVIIAGYEDKTRPKIRKWWASKSAGEAYGMKIYKPEKKAKEVREDTLPEDAIIVDYVSKFVDLDNVEMKDNENRFV